MMSLALVMIAVAVLPAALAATATCTAPLMAVNGVPDKCFWYAYLDVPMTNEFLINLCGSEALGGEGKLFRPTSRDELDRVNITMIPKILHENWKGQYPVDFTKYTLYKGSVWTSQYTNCVGVPADFPKDEQNETVWGTYTCPFELMAPGMWAKGEPNNDHGGIEYCVHGGWDHAGTNYGLNDIKCSYEFHSVICEFPSEN